MTSVLPAATEGASWNLGGCACIVLTILAGAIEVQAAPFAKIVKTVACIRDTVPVLPRGGTLRKDAEPIVRGSLPKKGSREDQERLIYTDGTAECAAQAFGGDAVEPWMNVLAHCEPFSPGALAFILESDEWAPLVRGRVLDCAAGSCWVTANLSKRSEVTEVVALDLSERFLLDTGRRVIRHLEGDLEKVSFVESSFNDIPFENGTFDAVFLVAAFHHSLAPFSTLLELRRLLKPDGALFIIETCTATIRVRRGRELALKMSRESGATEICCTQGELEYFIRQAGFTDYRVISLDDFTPSRVKRFVRRRLRSSGIEGLVLGTTNVVVARRTDAEW